MKGKVQIKGNEALNIIYQLCNRKRYFTCGNSTAYDRVLGMAKQGVHLEGIARCIWVCSGDDFKYEDVYREVYNALMHEEGGEEKWTN